MILSSEKHASELSTLDAQRSSEQDLREKREKELEQLQVKFTVSADEIERLSRSLDDESTRRRNLELFVLAHCQKVMGESSSFLLLF